MSSGSPEEPASSATDNPTALAPVPAERALDKSSATIVSAPITGEKRRRPAYFSRELSHLVSWCMDRSDHKRPTARQVLKHRFFMRYPPQKEDVKLLLKQALQFAT